MKVTTIRIDQQDKEKATQLAKDLGMTFNSLVRVLLKKAIKENKINVKI